ncbi:unnamed protein product [Cylindrotheca closterium]|uniref:Uncharacterized protein n=1 Tax=Cylindrotheca closterium TaxID=2856 RepID=A0AAD2GEL4_9STRA|nr:unnamed protein product [Cylindrotheca closterium]CAJ1970447.1 unnamed protein product [Cylindrotheca closterium]CAJ1970448.1 unnamed protein product [Cylindrotheca closterium]CAJ1970449.1 unnamed protein product [Cylindrotheca closterium]
MESSAETACTGKGLMPLAKRRIVKSAMSHKELNLSLFGRPWTTMECFYKEDNMFVRAQAGDMLMVRFQCDICHFRNLAKRLPDPGQPKEDEEILEHVCLCKLWSLILCWRNNCNSEGPWKH